MSAGAPHPPVSIVIPTWNGRALLERFLPSVVRALERYPGGGEIVVSDDGSTDDTAAFLRRFFCGVRLEVSPVNQGFAAAVNRGVSLARHQILVLLNNDVEADAELLAPLVAPLAEPDVFATHALSLDWDHARFHDGGKLGRWRRGFWRVWQNYQAEPGTAGLLSFYAPGGFAAYDREKWRALGGLDELYSPFNWEDTDLCYRALKRGWRVLYVPEAIAYHRPSTTIGGGAIRRARVRYISRRNRLLFHWKNLTDRPMLLANLCFCLLSLPAALLRLDFPSLAAFAGAVCRLPELRARRKVERREAVRSDRELARLFRDFPGGRPELRAVGRHGRGA